MIYKYLDTNGLPALFTQTLFAKIVTEFNDPFECDLLHTLEGKNKSEHSEYAHFPKFITGAQLLSKERIELGNPNDFPYYKIENSKSFLTNTRILFPVVCFSRDPKSILMWSHYAEHHKGFVLGFSPRNFFDDSGNSSDRFKKVNYSDIKQDFPLESLESDKLRIKFAQAFEKALFLKARCWRYEQEVRLMQPALSLKRINKNTYGVNYNLNSIKSIHLGSNISPELKKLIIDFAFTLRKPPKIIQLKRSESKFLLEENIIDRSSYST